MSLFVLNHEIDCREEYLDNLCVIDEMGGDRYSDHPVNVERHGFRPVSLQEAGRLLAEHDYIIPFWKGVPVTTLHIFRSRPDRQVRELIRVITPGRIRALALYEELVDYDQLIDALFSHDRVISWW